MKRLMTSTAIAMIAASAAMAATDIKDVDMTGDAFVGYEELKLTFPKVSEQFFDQIDTNDDNRISSEELLEPDAQDILARYTMVGMDERAQVVLDANHDRFVSKEEFVNVFPSFTEIDFEEMDANNDNRASYAEIYATDAQNIIARYYGDTVRGIADIDTNGDRFADFEEMANAFSGITNESLEEIDTNNDNRVSSVELYANDAQQIVARY